MSVMRKCYRSGSNAVIDYYLNDELFHSDIESKRVCGVTWFQGLPDNEADAAYEEVYPYPHHIEVKLDELNYY